MPIVAALTTFWFIHQNQLLRLVFAPASDRTALLRTATGDLYDVCAPIQELRSLNHQIAPILDELTLSPFYRHYRINMERECPFWAQQRLCNTGKCTVCECTDDEVPDFWRVQKSKAGFGHQLGFTSTFEQAPPRREPECPESLNEWCIDDVIDEDAEYEQSIFVDLAQNRESYTGYAGEPVWRTIYAENCDCLDGIDAQ